MIFKINKKIKSLIVFLFICFILLLFFDLYVSFSSSNKIYYELNKLNKTEFCLLLGTSKYIKDRNTKNKTENLFYRYRLDAVKELFDKSIIQKVIASGDNRTSHYNETKNMKNDLLKLNIPESSIITDNDGFRTILSIVNLCNKYNINNAIVISQKFHLERAIFLGKFFGLNLIGYAAKPVRGWANIKIQIRERGARVRLLFDIFNFFVIKPMFRGQYE